MYTVRYAQYANVCVEVVSNGGVRTVSTYVCVWCCSCVVVVVLTGVLVFVLFFVIYGACCLCAGPVHPVNLTPHGFVLREMYAIACVVLSEFDAIGVCT